MDLSYRSTIAIYKVSAGTKGCSCLPGGDVCVGREELFSAKDSLEGWTARDWICPWAELQHLLWALSCV